MSAVKYKQFYQLMWENNEPLLKDFQKIHDAFQDNPGAHAREFHGVGRDVLDVMRDWERRLCHGMEKGKFAAYSATLAEKFWAEIKKDFPLIDQVGVITHQA